MRALWFTVVAALAAHAQSLIPVEKLPERWRNLDRLPSEQSMPCKVHSIRPNLNLGFRFQTGYSVEVPMREYQGKNHWWAAVLRVTPKLKEREPAWFVSRMRIPAVPDPKAKGEFSGSFLVGEGEYRVDMLLTDDSKRVCTAGWDISAKLKKAAREVGPGLPAGLVDDLSLRRWSRMRPPDPEDWRRYKVSILVHAAAGLPGRMRMRGYDRTLLLSALSSMVERLPVRNVRLTVFSMDKQEEVYHTPDLNLETFRTAMDRLNRLELGTIDYDVLTKPRGHLGLVSELLEREMATKPDAVIFLGPVAKWTDRVPDESLRNERRSIPTYYVQLRPFRLAYGIQPDTISRTVRRLGGKEKQVYSPEDFAEALQAIEQLLAN